MPNNYIDKYVSSNNTEYDIRDSEVRDIIADTSEENALNHLGFFLDSHGGLCQVNEI